MKSFSSIRCASRTCSHSPPPCRRKWSSGTLCGGDLKIFADRFNTLPAAAFDTQLAAAFCGYGIAISLGDLVYDIAGVRLRKSHTVSDWSTRPLSPGQIDYLVDDVRYLFALQDRLTERLHAAGRYGWFTDDARGLIDIDRFRPDPERLYLRVPGAMRMSRRELGILRELANLRDQLARERDVPLKYIIPDDVMAPIVSLRPSRRDDLAALRRLDAGIRKAFGERIVAAVAAGVALDEAELPRKPARPPGSEREAIASCLSVLVNAIAADNGLPPALLVTRTALRARRARVGGDGRGGGPGAGGRVVASAVSRRTAIRFAFRRDCVDDRRRTTRNAARRARFAIVRPHAAASGVTPGPGRCCTAPARRHGVALGV